MRSRWFTMVVVGALGAGLVGVAQDTGSATAATPITYSRTLTGTDFMSLDVRMVPEFVTGTGGGVYGLYRDDGSNQLPATTYLEARLDLPVGAALTSITFYYKDCGDNPGGGTVYPRAVFYAGYYTPSNGGFSFVRPEASGGFGDCAQRYAFTRAGNPIATVVANRRYTLGAHVINDGLEIGAPPTADPAWFLAGANIKYTCSGNCF